MENIKAIILAGGFGSRLSEETSTKPKPLIEIGGRPILWHIMKHYSFHGINKFVICCGYKGYLIKEYFANYFLHMSDVTFDIKNNKMKVHQRFAEPWEVTLVETGDNTMTGGRIKKISSYVENDKLFCLTYGDGVSNVNIKKLISFHCAHGKKATLTAVYPPGRFGSIHLNKKNQVKSFFEKPRGDGVMINGGYFVLNPSVLTYIYDDQTVWEKKPLENLARDGQLMAFKHKGFWQPMDTLRDKNHLEELWATGMAPWKAWG